MLSFATPTANAMLQKLADRLDGAGSPAELVFYGSYRSDGYATSDVFPTTAEQPLNILEGAKEQGRFALPNPCGTVANKGLTFNRTPDFRPTGAVFSFGRFMKNGEVVLHGVVGQRHWPRAFRDLLHWGDDNVAELICFIAGGTVTLP